MEAACATQASAMSMVPSPVGVAPLSGERSLSTVAAMASLSNLLKGDFYKQYENDLRNGTATFNP